MAHELGEVAIALMTGKDVTTVETWLAVTERHTLTPQQYADFLRQANADPETRADIGFLTEKIRAYPEYQANATAAMADDNRYLGRGSNGKAYWFEQNGANFAVKTGGASLQAVRAFRRGRDIRHISHLEAVDLDQGMSVMNLVPGNLVETMSVAERLTIPREHIQGVVETALQMHDAGLIIDPKPSNFLYDPSQGFSVIDYLPAGDRGLSPRSRAAQVLGLGGMLIYQPWAGSPTPDSANYDSWRRQRAADDVSMLNRYLDVLEEGHPDILREARDEQQAINQNPGIRSFGMVYDTYHMPTGEPFDDFKARVEQLGLEGTPPRE